MIWFEGEKKSNFKTNLNLKFNPDKKDTWNFVSFSCVIFLPSESKKIWSRCISLTPVAL